MFLLFALFMVLFFFGVAGPFLFKLIGTILLIVFAILFIKLAFWIFLIGIAIAGISRISRI
ncbi:MULTISPECIES: hypothetical protein [Lactobacillaceae]|uniref:hypothetical protein n=1 Tax=Lactobacillaceae TaxID=33958 RepID=UPI000C1B7453|nr:MULTISPECIES: hypothetical protein [Lactobacillaceae]